MEIYIQSKSGDFNVERYKISNTKSLVTALKWLRDDGGYRTEDRKGRKHFIPFEQIEFIAEAEPDGAE